jgi:hypothetical protein
MWASANLSRQAVIVTDPQTAAALRAAGFSAVTTFSAGAKAAPQTLAYVVNRVGGEASASVGRRRVVGMTLPLAVFGSGATGVTVGQVFANGSAAAHQDEARDAQLRKSGGTQLLANPAITTTAAAATALGDGELDLRAQNVCNVLAAGGRIWLSVNRQPVAERRAGLPIRSITITAANPSALEVTLAALTPPFIPTIIQISPGKVRLTWPPQIAPVGIVR